MNMTRELARAYVGYCVDAAACARPTGEVPRDDRYVRYVGYAAGFEPMVVAVWSYLPGCAVDDAEAEALAGDLLREVGWFGGAAPSDPVFIV